MTLVSDDPTTTTETENPKEKKRLKARSVSFAPTVDEFEIPSRTSPAYEYRRQDFLDALVDSYKVQTAVNLSFALNNEEKYRPKTTRSRANLQGREHRIRHLMNKVEELSLWDREEELKGSQARFLREQKLEQIIDRQRNNDLCWNLMRQRHESEMESAVLLDRRPSKFDDEWRKSSIAQARRLPHSSSLTSIPTAVQWRSPTGRFRHFQTQMNDKVEKLNERFPSVAPRRYASVPANVVPLFSETYLSLMNLPARIRPKSNSDEETRRRAHSSRDVRVPLKENINNNARDDERRRTGKASLPDLRESPYEDNLLDQPEFRHHQIKANAFAAATLRNGVFA